MKKMIALMIGAMLALASLVGLPAATASTTTSDLWKNCVTGKEWKKVAAAEKKSKGSIGPATFYKMTKATGKTEYRVYKGTRVSSATASYRICGTEERANIVWGWRSPVTEQFVIEKMNWPKGVKSKPRPSGVTAMPFKANRGPQTNPFKAN